MLTRTGLLKPGAAKLPDERGESGTRPRRIAEAQLGNFLSPAPRVLEGQKGPALASGAKVVPKAT